MQRISDHITSLRPRLHVRLLIFCLVGSGLGCGKTPIDIKKYAEDDHCASIDTLIWERYLWKSGNFFSSGIIPRLVEASGIESSGSQRTFGYVFANDSVFNKDVEAWKAFFNCS